MNVNDESATDRLRCWALETVVWFFTVEGVAREFSELMNVSRQMV